MAHIEASKDSYTHQFCHCHQGWRPLICVCVSLCVCVCVCVRTCLHLCLHAHVCLPCRVETFWPWTDVKCKGPGIKMTASQIPLLGYVLEQQLCFFFHQIRLKHLFLRFLFSNLPAPFECPFLPWVLVVFQEKVKREVVSKGKQTKQHSHQLWISRADKAAHTGYRVPHLSTVYLAPLTAPLTLFWISELKGTVFPQPAAKRPWLSVLSVMVGSHSLFPTTTAMLNNSQGQHLPPPSLSPLSQLLS